MFVCKKTLESALKIGSVFRTETQLASPISKRASPLSLIIPSMVYKQRASTVPFLCVQKVLESATSRSRHF